MRDAHLAPVNAIAVLPLLMLIAGEVDAVDALRGIVKALALVDVVAPLANAEIAALRGKAEARALVVFPLPFVVGAQRVAVMTVAVGLQMTVEFTGIDASRIAAGAGDEGVVVPLPFHLAAKGVVHPAQALPEAIMPGTAVKNRIALIEYAQALTMTVGHLTAVGEAVVGDGHDLVAADGATRQQRDDGEQWNEPHRLSHGITSFLEMIPR